MFGLEPAAAEMPRRVNGGPEYLLDQPTLSGAWLQESTGPGRR